MCQWDHPHSCLVHQLIMSVFPSAITGQSMRARKATALAERDVPPNLIQTAGQWTLETFNHYVWKNSLFKALLIGPSSLTFVGCWVVLIFLIVLLTLLLSDCYFSHCFTKLSQLHFWRSAFNYYISKYNSHQTHTSLNPSSLFSIIKPSFLSLSSYLAL